MKFKFHGLFLFVCLRVGDKIYEVVRLKVGESEGNSQYLAYRYIIEDP